MAFFQQLRQLFAGSPAPVQDLSFGLLDALGIKLLLQQKRWSQFETVAGRLAPDDFTRLLDGLCLTAEHSALLAGYQQAGNSEMRHLLAGVHATWLAWQARSGVYGRELSQKQIEGFTAFLTEACEQLNRSFAPPLLRAEAAARMVRVAMGLGEPEMAQKAFEYCLDTNPTHLQGHLFYFNFRTPKWYGSEDALADFVDRAPTPELRKLLQAMRLVELANEIDDRAAAVKQQFHHNNALGIEGLLAELPVPATSLYNIYLANYLAGLHHALGQFGQRNAFLVKLGPAITYYPWMYSGLDWQAVQSLAKK